MFNEEKAQSSAELILFIGFILVIFIISLNFILSENELNQAVLAASKGVNDGLVSDSLAVYPEQTFNEYSLNKKSLLSPYDIKVLKIEYRDNGFDEKSNKTRIQFKVYVTSSKITDYQDRDSAGDRINFNLRKSLAYTFNSTSSTNGLFNPVYSKNYIFTTANVVWV